jgi:molybdopterin-guanine dinucleotide biosynthesis protein A
MIAIVTAGGEAQPGEPLYELTQGGLKAMLEINGKPMVQWVLDALGGVNRIEHVVLVGLPPETDLVCTHPMIILPDEGSMLGNIRAGAVEASRIAPDDTHALLVSGDVPGIRPDILEWLLDQASDPSIDLYYSVIERASMEAEFPNSRRTYIHLKNMQVCGGDVHCFRMAAAVEEGPLWKKLIDARKSPIRQASLVGYDTLFFLVLRQLSLKDAEQMACKRLNIKARAVLCPYPQIGMDVDKPFQYEMIRDYLTHARETQFAGPA